jgi:hypothetical protein
MFGNAAAGALVVSSVDGDYLRTPLTRAGWGLFDYNVVVGDMEAPSDKSTNASSFDLDYLRAPLIAAGWELPNKNAVVGNMEAPLDNSNNEWQFVEGTSITAAAAVSPHTCTCCFPPNFSFNLISGGCQHHCRCGGKPTYLYMLFFPQLFI